jgi:hypothetical protein
MVTKRRLQGAGRTPTGRAPLLTRTPYPYSYVRIPRNSPPQPISNRHLVKLKCDVTSTKQTEIKFLTGHRCTFSNSATAEFALRPSSGRSNVSLPLPASVAAGRSDHASTRQLNSATAEFTLRNAGGMTKGLFSLPNASLRFCFASQFPVESHLIISNRSVPRLETYLTPFAPTPTPVLIDTNSATKNTTSSPPALNLSPREFTLRNARGIANAPS